MPRRAFLQLLGVAAGALTAPSLLTACEPSPSGGALRLPTDWDAWWKGRRIAGVLDLANWPYYIDRRRDNSHPSLERFTARTGIRVRYFRPIRDNAEFLDQIRPTLEAGEPSLYDIIVITNGPELSELMDRGWLTPLDHSRLTTFARNAGPLVRDPPWDRGNRFTVAWQSGITGIAYRPEAVRALGREPSSLHDLWDPALAGRVGMLRDLMDLGSAGLLSLGIDPQTSTTLGWQRAAEALRGQRDAGLVRGYYDQGYLWALQTGRTWISQAWSGDIFQANQLGHPELRFVVPEEGAMLWTDNMMIPVTARHPLDALTYMDFVYRPEIAAMIADWVWYMTPVPASRSIIADVFHDQPVADSPLVFPGRDLLGEPWSYLAPDAEGRLEKHTTFLNSRLRNYYVFGDAAEYRAWRRLFEPIAAGA